MDDGRHPQVLFIGGSDSPVATCPPMNSGTGERLIARKALQLDVASGPFQHFDVAPEAAEREDPAAGVNLPP